TAATATDVKAPAHVAPTAGVKEPAHVAPETTDVKEPAPPAARRRKPIGWIVAIAAAAGLLVLGLLFSSSRHRETGPDTSARAPERIEHAPQVPRGPMVPNLPTPTAQHEPTSETTTTGAVLGPAELDEHFAGTGPTPDRVEAPLTFDPSGTLSGDGAIAIDRIATLMKDHPSTRIRLEGLGGALDETLAHAERVKGMLVERGVDPGRVETAAQPSEPGATDQPREEGRRVAIVILAR
ncbi:MAG: hypothetical protein KIS78_36795, partial [Labilithrix sp.]|nr:hypothetical protein [Labilithrix sp.]